MVLSSFSARSPPQKYTVFPAATARTGRPPPMSVTAVWLGARKTSSHDLISASSLVSRMQLRDGRLNQRSVSPAAVTSTFGSTAHTINLMFSLCAPSPISNAIDELIVTGTTGVPSGCGSGRVSCRSERRAAAPHGPPESGIGPTFGAERAPAPQFGLSEADSWAGGTSRQPGMYAPYLIRTPSDECLQRSSFTHSFIMVSSRSWNTKRSTVSSPRPTVAFHLSFPNAPPTQHSLLQSRNSKQYWTNSLKPVQRTVKKLHKTRFF